ncbi:MAG TPA: hypothetical protein VMB77_01520 [Syntrophales bacterium]|nr:hypothetical protein [Syntrophales bacterium]
MKRLIYSTQLSILFLSILFILACGGSGGGSGDSPAPPAPAFTTADLAGLSNTVGVSTGGTNQGIMAGNATLSSSGIVTSGSYTHSAGANATLTGGSLSLDNQGLISGVMNTNVGITSTLLHGKLNASKSFGTFVASTNFGEYDLVTFIKSGGSFTSADLPGTWHVCEISSGGSLENVYYGTLIVYSGGSFAASRSNGTVSINSYGIFTGSGNVIPSGTLSINGAMDSSKEFGIFYTVYSSGEYSISIAIKETGVFSLSDLAGTWHFTLASNGASEGISYGTIQLDSAGQVRGGYYKASGGNVTLSGGSVSISTAGVLSGIINASDGVTFTLLYGKMNLSKNMMSTAGYSNTGGRDFIIAHKES